MNHSTEVNDRHLSLSGLERFLRSAVPILHPVAGEPTAAIFIDPRVPEMGLRVRDISTIPLPNTNLRNVNLRRTIHRGHSHLEVVVTDPKLFREAYVVLCATIDRIQIDGLTPIKALSTTFDKLSRLLQNSDELSLERELGLFGELLVLAGLIESVGTEEALASWRGGDSEEHDFGLRDIDIEVKTTTNERRVHWIESLTQLVPTRRRPLWLVSHQITTAGAGQGYKLPELIEHVRGVLDTGTARAAFELGLSKSGWWDGVESSFQHRWTKRSRTQAYRVVDEFPRLTPEALERAGLSISRFSEVKYRIDLNELAGENTPPFVLEETLKFEGHDD